jgi:hypothetical protein
MVARIVDQIGQAAESGPTALAQSTSDSKAVTEDRPDDRPLRVAASSGPADENAQVPSDSQVLLQSNKVDNAVQHDVEEGEEVFPQASRRSHGRALPR